MSEYTAEEVKEMKIFLDDVEQRLNHSQSLHHNSIDWHPAYGTLEEWQAKRDADFQHLIEQWNMLRSLRKQYGIK